MKTQAIIPLAGTGARFQASLAAPNNIPKPFIVLNGKPLFVYTLEALQASSLIDSLIVVVHETYVTECEAMARQYGLAKIRHIIPGGETRADSVRQGLPLLAADTELVLIHDGVRPLITVELIDAAITLGRQHPAVITAVPVKPTIKRIDYQNMLVKETLDRVAVWEVQTPQVFHKKIILQAHEQFKAEKTYAGKSEATDDAVLVERLGIPVKVLKGDYKNIKVTTQDDLILVEALLSFRLACRPPAGRAG